MRRDDPNLPHLRQVAEALGNYLIEKRQALETLHRLGTGHFGTVTPIKRHARQ